MTRRKARPIITLTTDFGGSDHYAACMKGVILSIAPEATIVDVAHDVTAHNVVHAAFVVRQIWPYFPPETIHVVVVDPTVGTDRRILAARYNGRVVIAPDNGVISLVHRDGAVEALHVVERRQLFAESLSATFHGRDIMAPVAARLATGLALHEVGRTTDRITMLDLPVPIRHDDGSLEGEVLYVDGFGNLITNLSRRDVGRVLAGAEGRQVRIGERVIGPIVPTYAAAPAAEPLALIGSTEMLEIAVNGGHAANVLGADVGARVVVH